MAQKAFTEQRIGENTLKNSLKTEPDEGGGHREHLFWKKIAPRSAEIVNHQRIVIEPIHTELRAPTPTVGSEVFLDSNGL